MTAVSAPRPAYASDVEQARYLDRWLKVWILLLTVVVIVVVVYLIAITDSLASINKHLGATTSAVVGAGNHVQTLPGQINQINASLTTINTALIPIHGQAGQIISDLTSINSSLTAVNSSLINTSGLLVNTSGSLVNTSGVLTNVLATGGAINTTLIQANLPAGNCGNGTVCSGSQLGVQNIWQRLTNANPVLVSARGDTNNVGNNEVPSINNSLIGICNGPVVTLVDSLPSLVTSVQGRRAC